MNSRYCPGIYLDETSQSKIWCLGQDLNWASVKYSYMSHTLPMGQLSGGDGRTFTSIDIQLPWILI